VCVCVCVGIMCIPRSDVVLHEEIVA
jgi:hypothetical protein